MRAITADGGSFVAPREWQIKHAQWARKRNKMMERYSWDGKPILVYADGKGSRDFYEQAA